MNKIGTLFTIRHFKNAKWLVRQAHDPEWPVVMANFHNRQSKGRSLRPGSIVILEICQYIP